MASTPDVVIHQMGLPPKAPLPDPDEPARPDNHAGVHERPRRALLSLSLRAKHGRTVSIAPAPSSFAPSPTSRLAPQSYRTRGTGGRADWVAAAAERVATLGSVASASASKLEPVDPYWERRAAPARLRLLSQSRHVDPVRTVSVSGLHRVGRCDHLQLGPAGPASAVRTGGTLDPAQYRNLYGRDPSGSTSSLRQVFAAASPASALTAARPFHLLDGRILSPFASSRGGRRQELRASAYPG